MSRQRRVFIFGPFVRVGLRCNFRTVEMACIEGNCLAPWIVDGDVVLFDREVEPLDGDLVVASMFYWRFSAALVGHSFRSSQAQRIRRKRRGSDG